MTERRACEKEQTCQEIIEEVVTGARALLAEENDLTCADLKI